MTTTRTKPVPGRGHDDEDDEDNAMKGRNVDTEGWARSFVRLARLAVKRSAGTKGRKILRTETFYPGIQFWLRGALQG